MSGCRQRRRAAPPPPRKLPRAAARVLSCSARSRCSSPAARPLALPAVDRQRVPAGAGRARSFARARGAGASRPHRRPLRRGARDVHAGQVALGVPATSSTPTPDAARVARAHPRDHAAALRRRARAATRTSRSSRSRLPPETAERAMALRIQGLLRAERVPPLLSRRRGDGARRRLHRRRGHRPGRHRARAAGVARAACPGSRRVIINRTRRRRRGRRGDPRAAGGPRPRALDRHAPAVPRVPRAQGRGRSATRRKAGGLVILDAKTGEILALANWPTTTRTTATRSRASRCAIAR